MLDAAVDAIPCHPWSLAVGIVATIGANLAYGLYHGPIGALASAWPALAPVSSFERPSLTAIAESIQGP